jgi:hypothetical protein
MPDYRFGGEELYGDYAGRGLDEGVLRDFKSWTRQANWDEAQRQPLETKLVRIERIAYEPAALGSLGGSWQPSDATALNCLMFCHAFPLDLEGRETRVVGHSYTTLTGSNVEQQYLFNYTLGTGRSWAGTIGKATVDLYLDDGLTIQDLQFDGDPEAYAATCSPGRAEWQKVEPRHFRLVWEDFEPEGGRGYIMLATRPQGMASTAE